VAREDGNGGGSASGAPAVFRQDEPLSEAFDFGGNQRIPARLFASMPTAAGWLKAVPHPLESRSLPALVAVELRTAQVEARGRVLDAETAVADAKAKLSAAVRLLMTALPREDIGEILHEVGALVSPMDPVDPAEYERLTGEPPPSIEEQIGTRVAALAEHFRRVGSMTDDTASEPTVRRRLNLAADELRDHLAPVPRLVAIRHGGQWRFPVWQFDEASPTGVVAGLEEVLQALVGVPRLQQVAWFTTRQPELDWAAPVTALREGDVDRVIRSAEALKTLTAGAP
jgi:hypothetical protein